ncbi:hypothetical protein ZIOFF_029663 [Zingiber officinale]|uniref:J domain-containing protein n=1 Tax=Zingiber officinale TaxID=94328 RepID=A0A8J5H8E8_ZINOF|nr:hypothetical protein ZIOFF_029663 [Zingiber officinale]
MPDLRSSGYSDTGPERGGAFWDVQRMGSHDSNPRRDIYGERGGSPPPWIPLSYGGGRVGNLVDRFSGLVLGDGRNEGVHQVIKALEDAESTIKQQVGFSLFDFTGILACDLDLVRRLFLYAVGLRNKPNSSFRGASMAYRQSKQDVHSGRITRSCLDLFNSQQGLLNPDFSNYSIKLMYRVKRLEVKSLRPEIPTNDQVDAYKISNSNSPAGHEAERRWIENHSPLNPQAMVLHQNGVVGREETHLESVTANQHTYGSNKVNGDLRKFPGVHSALGSAGPSQYSTPSSRSLSPSRHQKEGGDQDKRFISSGNCLVPVSNLNSSTLWKQVREHEEEIAQLRKHLADYSIKEAQIRNEKYVLEKRIAYMRMAFDQQQQDLVDAASKAISYRQDIIEENIRLTYALQAAHAERSTFVSSLVPILSEHGLQPSVVDAQSIVSNLKVLFTHMQERFIIAEICIFWGETSRHHLGEEDALRSGIVPLVIGSPHIATDVSYPPPPSIPPDVSNCDFDGGNANIHVSEVDTIIPSHATSSVVSSDMDVSKMKIDATTILQHCKDTVFKMEVDSFTVFEWQQGKEEDKIKDEVLVPRCSYITPSFGFDGDILNCDDFEIANDQTYREIALKYHPDKQTALILAEETEKARQTTKDKIENHLKHLIKKP